MKKPAGGARSESSSPAPRNIVRHQACAASAAVPLSKFWNLASCITKIGAWSAWPLRAGGLDTCQTLSSTSSFRDVGKSSNVIESGAASA